jgi:hypothetical protein
MACPPHMFLDVSAMCIEPPLPLDMPVALPSNSAITSLAEMPQFNATP